MFVLFVSAWLHFSHLREMRSMKHNMAIFFDALRNKVRKYYHKICINTTPFSFENIKWNEELHGVDLKLV